MVELKILKNRKRGPYVEFNTTGENWDNSSIFLDEVVFGVFSNSFDNSHENFNYYGPTAFRELELINLHNELKEFGSEMSGIFDFDSFLKTISTSPMGNNFLGELASEDKVNLKLQWNQVVKALKEINQTLLELIENCAKENKTLWVLGI
ncbi:MAG: hypothetical protein IPL71_09555 [Anaerolineales bacterium]|uniref:hypothetical protein n=1 Tax=Candidatus Villigracilis proximus TaxID=3140683 RepID=UPI0031346827|nr:hypothetical protein [Anaerolineales bacterium]